MFSSLAGNVCKQDANTDAKFRSKLPQSVEMAGACLSTPRLGDGNSFCLTVRGTGLEPKLGQMTQVPFKCTCR